MSTLRLRPSGRARVRLRCFLCPHPSRGQGRGAQTPAEAPGLAWWAGRGHTPLRRRLQSQARRIIPPPGTQGIFSGALLYLSPQPRPWPVLSTAWCQRASRLGQPSAHWPFPDPTLSTEGTLPLPQPPSTTKAALTVGSVTRCRRPAKAKDASKKRRGLCNARRTQGSASESERRNTHGPSLYLSPCGPRPANVDYASGPFRRPCRKARGCWSPAIAEGLARYQR